MTGPSPLFAALADRYRIERELGAGGMATVYLAEDVRHRRQVAVKVLRPELAATMGPDRFLREIEIAARLQHPHILPLLDSGDADGFLFYVMPFVQGESLRERLAREHELPVTDAVRIIAEVADALAHAHEHGVVHRDIKPENIMLSGRHALVTDFGVAKAVSEASGPLRLTSVGVALGTPTYMAPEQASADPAIDHRVDIYALGVVAYELLAGRPPFTGRTAQEVLAAHMTRAPEPVRNYRGSVSPALDATVLRCLEKHPADRWQSTADLLAQLEPLGTPSGGVTPTATRPVSTAPAVRPQGIPRWLAWVGGGALVAAGAFALSIRQQPEPALLVGRRTAVAVAPGWERWPSFAADGKTIVYSRGAIGSSELVVQQIGGGSPIPIRTQLPGWQCCGAVSPDGSRLLFLTAQGLFVVPTLGGQPRVVRENRDTNQTQAVPRVLWGSWSPSGREIAYTELDTVFVQPVESGERRVVAYAKDAHSPAWSPDARFIAFVRGNTLFHRNGNLAPAAIAIVASDGGDVAIVSDTSSFNTNPVWLDRSRLLFISDRDGGRDVYVQHLSRAGRPSGAPVRITTGLGPDRIAVSADASTLAWSTLVETTAIASLPIPSGGDSLPLSRATPVIAGSETIEVVTASRDGRWLYYDSDLRGSADIWRIPLSDRGVQAGEPQQVTNDPAAEFSPSPSPDGTRVTFHSFRSGNRDLFVAPATGGGSPVQITTSPEHDWNPQWSPDGKRILFDRQLAPDSTLWVIDQLPDGGWTAPRALPIGRGALLPRWSPDGTRIAFGFPSGITVHELATGRTWVAGVPSRNAAWTEWSEDGRTIYAAGVNHDGSVRVWGMPAEGGAVRTLAYAEEGDLRTHRHGLTIAAGRFYIVLIERKADVWVADLRNP